MLRFFYWSLIFLFLNCAGKSEKRLMIWHSFRPEGREILQRQLAQFKQRLLAGNNLKYQDWEFEERFYAPEEARTNYIVSTLAGKGPALFRGASDNVGPLVELGVIQPMDPFLEPAFLDSFITTPISAAVWHKNHLYQLADEIGNHLCLVYNKKYISKPPETIQEMIQMWPRIQKKSPDPSLKYLLAWNYIEPYFVVPFIGGYNGWLLDENNQPTLNTAAVVQASQLIYDLAHKHQLIPEECDYEMANALFGDGISAMIINGPWSWGNYLNRQIDIGITRIPKIDETGLWPTPIVSPLGYSLNVNLKGEELQLAIKLLKFLTEPAQQLAYTRQFGSIPTRKEAWRDSTVTADPILQQSIYQLEVGKPMPVVTELRWIWDAMRPAYQAIFTNDITPVQAAEKMQQDALKLIRENRE
ncbi:extracellular solute-binding protein [candidate division KSB1 bacterium]|nr:extracellular solute-binding protein [candidate division KSB1 bacterium]